MACKLDIAGALELELVRRDLEFVASESLSVVVDVEVLAFSFPNSSVRPRVFSSGP